MTVDIDLGGRVAVITGGGGGIGAGIADVLARAGAHVVIAERDPGRAEAAAAAIARAGGSAEDLVVDVQTPDGVEALASHVLAAHGRVDILVNNVGHYLRVTPFLDSTEQHWDALHSVNLLHVFRCTRAFLPGMVAQGSGCVINVASVEGVRGYPADPVYGAYKAAVAHFTRSLALEVAPSGVRVNAIAPDVTQSIQVDYSNVPAELADRWPVWVPIGRAGLPPDNADVVLFLASDLSRFVVGQVIPTDGGTLVAGGWFRTVRGGHWTNRPRNP